MKRRRHSTEPSDPARPASPEHPELVELVELVDRLDHPPDRRRRPSSPSLMEEDERIDATLERMQHTGELEFPSGDGTRWMLRKDPRFRKGAAEVWAEMPGMRGVWVSTHGRLKTQFKGTWRRPYRPNRNQKGYRKFYYTAPGTEKSKLFGVHSCVATTFLGPPPSGDHTADHVDVDSQDNRANNFIWNLRWASRTEQGKNRRKQEEAKQHSRPCFGRAVVGGGDDWVEYKGTCDAAKKLGLYSANIDRVCNGKVKTTSGYVFKWMPIPEPLPGEVWKLYKNGTHVSDMGRVKLKSGWIYTPLPTRGTVYASFYSTLFHIVVCTLFNEARPSRHHTVDHWDRDPTNNKAENLRWKTPSEQVKNQDLPALGDGNRDSLKRRVKVIHPDGTIQHFLGLAEAARQLKINFGTLRSRILNKSVTKGVRFEYEE